MAVEGGEADAEMGGIGLAEFRDVIGDSAGVFAGEIGVAGVQEPQQRRFRAGPDRWAGRRGRRVFHRLLLCNAIRVCATGPARAAGVAPEGARAGPWE